MANERSKLAFKKTFPVFKRFLQSKDLALVVFVIAILAIIIVPLPPFVLDFLLTISIALSVLIILIGLYIDKPTDFSAFPTLLLIVTLYRLALNVATTRMILTQGYKGPSAVSDIITAFGEFSVSGNYVIGAIIFSILVLVNLLVVTNGSTRVTEVRARFALDAMPGKQMAIDADLNSGLIDDKEAKKRRAALSQEADFYGAMDGASKFVKGDAIASIIITLINIIGGFLVGVFQRDMSLSFSASTFTILTIGDGLVGQIPALIIATATGIVATRTTQNEEEDFASKLITQLTNKSKTLVIVGAILLLFATIPGLPTFSLAFVGTLFLFIAWLISREGKDGLLTKLENYLSQKFGLDLSEKPHSSKIKPHAPTTKTKTQEEIKREEEQAIDEVLKIEFLELALGYQLISLADMKQGGDLLERIRGIRKKIASDYGFLMPQIRIRDNLQLPPTHYEIKLKGIVIGEGMVMPDKFLAMNTGFVNKEIEGIPTKEPAFGMDALWIETKNKEEAIIQGYTIIDPSTVIATHTSELVKKYAEDFITKDEVKSLLERLAKDYPTIVEESKKIPTGAIRSVLQALLHEKIPIKDMLTILETITDIAPLVQNDVNILTEQVRARLSRVITNAFKSEDGRLKFLTFSTDSEQFLLNKLRENGTSKSLLLNVGELQKLIEGVSEEAMKVLQKGIAPVILIVEPNLRKALSNQMEQARIDVVVLSHAELDPNSNFEALGTIHINF
ncbi:flagellar biosynthesis protein FlhA [Helicobacter pylori]|uniref:Flagellar biosynthesis protein FlhA n=1 Tax=Helicobacter pylori TaxID=210 RepID=A0A438PX71_HELPX|nr:flagellar biosynthesis protein FlhA [Helicobacter pylori]EJB68381.1 flagellar biosynthesis protein FlhA [Helicobacter pylori Hp A-6]MBH0257387.1 flagellar biosynthesis protein FlhA [Helicobacter pylori]PDX49640.1 flagellar biosynthesis protein FlhA [Helicobacter pylori]RVY30142.1 flagellar biosynthesis protein FlhA [Helicobacter pylori]WQU07611.1 flagellar biosynthesis protein FlhA [Helicobacter pylori]